MVAARWHVAGALLLFALGLAALSFSLLGERRSSWWATALVGLVEMGWAMKWLRDIHARSVTK